MEEFFPIVAGVVAGLAVRQFVPFKFKTVSLVLLSLLFGFLAFFLSGEIARSWLYLIFDIGQFFVAAAIAIWLAGWLERRAPRSH